MPQNLEGYADTSLSQLIAAHTELRSAIDWTEDDDQINLISDTMLAIEVELAPRPPGSKQDAIGKLGLLIALYPEEHHSVLRQTLDSLIVWASTLP